MECWNHVSDDEVFAAHRKAFGLHEDMMNNRRAMIEALNEKYRTEDYQRYEAFNDGEWHCVGVIAKAEIRNPDTHVTQTVRSGGLWGVESDAGDYIKDEVGPEQLRELRTELMAMGIGERAIAHAFKSVEYVNK